MGGPNQNDAGIGTDRIMVKKANHKAAKPEMAAPPQRNRGRCSQEEERQRRATEIKVGRPRSEPTVPRIQEWVVRESPKHIKNQMVQAIPTTTAALIPLS